MEYMNDMLDYMHSITGLNNQSNCALLAHFISFPIAIWFNKYRPAEGSYLSRPNVSCAVGLAIVAASYRWSSLQLLIQWVLAYMVYKLVPKHSIGKYTFFVTLGHVLANHGYCFAYHYGQLDSIDYTGTLMIGTMKLTSLAFSVEDSVRSESKLTTMQKKYVIIEEPTIQEHFTYTFSFVGILFGPFIFYKDYRTFMDIRTRADNSNLRQAALSFVLGIASVVAFLLLLPEYDVTRNYAPEILASGFLYKHWFLYVSMFCAKCKYYFAWLTAQSISLCAGLGQVDVAITETVNPVQIELVTSLKQFVDNWNMFAGKWLRFAVYERVRMCKAMCTFIVSAIWHGFYPGYLMMFVPLACYLALGRKLHKVVQPKFQTTKTLSVVYSVITWIGTAICICFNGTGFQLLYFDKVSQVQLGFYFYPHIIALILYILIPEPSKSESATCTAIPDANGNGKQHAD